MLSYNHAFIFPSVAVEKMNYSAISEYSWKFYNTFKNININKNKLKEVFCYQGHNNLKKQEQVVFQTEKIFVHVVMLLLIKHKPVDHCMAHRELTYTMNYITWIELEIIFLFWVWQRTLSARETLILERKFVKLNYKHFIWKGIPFLNTSPLPQILISDPKN